MIRMMFSLRILVNVKHLRAGSIRWGDHRFIVVDFDHLDGLGFSDKPMVAGGYPLLAGRNIYLDFEKNKLWIEPSLKADYPEN